MIRIFLFFIAFFPSLAIAQVTPWVDFITDNGLIKIPVVIGGVETQALLDTGATINGIDPNFIKEHNLDLGKGQKYTVQGVVATAKNRKSYNRVNVNMFGGDVVFDNIVELNLSRETPFLIGGGFFGKFIFQIDYPNSRLRLMTRDAIDLAEFQNIRIRAQRGSGKPIVQLKIGEKPVWGLLDTGSNGGLLVTRKVAKRIDAISESNEKSSLKGVNEVGMIESTVARDVTFGPYELGGVEVWFPEEGGSLNIQSQFEPAAGSRVKGRKVEAIIGYDVLKHFVLTIDYYGGRMHVGLPKESS